MAASVSAPCALPNSTVPDSTVSSVRPSGSTLMSQSVCPGWRRWRRGLPFQRAAGGRRVASRRAGIQAQVVSLSASGDGLTCSTVFWCRRNGSRRQTMGHAGGPAVRYKVACSQGLCRCARGPGGRAGGPLIARPCRSMISAAAPRRNSAARAPAGQPVPAAQKAGRARRTANRMGAFTDAAGKVPGCAGNYVVRPAGDAWMANRKSNSTVKNARVDRPFDGLVCPDRQSGCSAKETCLHRAVSKSVCRPVSSTPTPNVPFHRQNTACM